jgi:hypothetical protein
MASRNSPEQLGTFTYGQYRDVIGRVTPPWKLKMFIHLELIKIL